ncbi:MAG: hypothetical protein GY868_17915 [Deltaproteobacteria bacterium]|nr:hypothetical protein [Deltaproteobacteria bacterium]
MYRKNTFIVVFLFCFIVSGTANQTAAEEGGEDARTKAAEQAGRQPPVKKGIPEKKPGTTTKKKKFVPSEKIKADTIVDFPADI